MPVVLDDSSSEEPEQMVLENTSLSSQKGAHMSLPCVADVLTNTR